MNTLLTRDAFREGVFARDGHKCVVCREPAVDAHHIMERRLFPDGGYYLDNGVSVCEEHHLKCESTEISTYELREYCGITTPILPDHLYQDQQYDKWGNILVDEEKGNRLRGELWYDDSVQKALKLRFYDVNHAFNKYVKYPRTFHLPWSPSVQNDDRLMPTTEHFEDRRVVVTEKMDGENTTMYNDYIHARSIDGRSHITRNWVKDLHGKIGWQLPVDWRICGENLYAEHSVQYRTLPSYFMGFSIWTRNVAMSWDDTVEWFEILDITPVTVLYDGIYDEQVIRDITIDTETSEGYVVRIADAINMSEFSKYVGKYVRTGHVQTDKHWMHGELKLNSLAG